MQPRTIRTWIVVTLLLCAAGADSAAGTEADTEKRALGFVKAVTSGDPDVAFEFIRENFLPSKVESRSDEDWKKLLGRLAGDLEDAEVTGVDIHAPLELELHVESAQGGIVLTFDFDAEPPHLISGLALESGGPPDGPGGNEFPTPDLSPGMNAAAVARNLAEYFDDLAADDLFSGTALVAIKGEPIFTTAHGLASHRFGVPNKLDTRFDLGSINKDFTKISIGQLHLAGKLELDDTISRHLPGYPNKDVAQRISIAQLLDHSSGLGDIFTSEYFRSAKTLYRKPSDFFPLFVDADLQFEPGTSQSYSNAGYMVLGAIIEAVSGMPYDEYVAAHVFEPAGMRDSGFFAHDEPVSDVAIGYTRRGPANPDGELRNNLLILPAKGNSAGSAYSTVEDLLRFVNAVMEHRMFPAPYSRWLFGGATPDREAAKKVRDAPKLSGLGVGLAGGAEGVSASISIEDDLVVIILSNYDSPIAERVVRALRRPLGNALR